MVVIQDPFATRMGKQGEVSRDSFVAYGVCGFHAVWYVVPEARPDRLTEWLVTEPDTEASWP